MRRQRAPAGFALVFIVAAGVLPAQSPVTRYVISGTVRLPDGSPAPRITIKATGQTGFDRQVFTDDMGRFELSEIPRGRYFLTATNPADPDQYTDPVEVDTSRSFSGRLVANIFLRNKVDNTTKKENKAATISVAEATQHVPKAAQKVFEQGLRFRSNQQVQKALESFDRAVELYPQYFQAIAERGHLRIGLGQIPDASADFAKALSLNDRYEPALRGSGMCKFQQARFAEAVSDLERATALDTNNATTYLFLGVANASLDRREPARRALEKALALDAAGAARARVHLANLYLKEDKLKDAAAQLDAYLEAVPNAPDVEKIRAVRGQIESRLAKP